MTASQCPDYLEYSLALTGVLIRKLICLQWNLSPFELYGWNANSDPRANCKYGKEFDHFKLSFFSSKWERALPGLHFIWLVDNWFVTRRRILFERSPMKRLAFSWKGSSHDWPMLKIGELNQARTIFSPPSEVYLAKTETLIVFVPVSTKHNCDSWTIFVG